MADVSMFAREVENVLKKIPAGMALAVAAAVWMLSGGALLAAAQDSSAASDSAAFPEGAAIPAGSTFVPDGSVAADGTVIPDGSILLPAGSVLSSGTPVEAGTVLMPDGTLMVFVDAGTWPAGDVVPDDFVFVPTALPFTQVVGGQLPITGGSQGLLAVVAFALISLGAGAFVARTVVDES